MCAQRCERKVSVPTSRRIRSEQGPCRTHYHTPGHQHLKWPSSTRRAQATMLAVQVQACMFAHGTLATRSSTSHLAGMQVSAQPRERKVSVPTFRRIRSEQGPCRTHYHTPGHQHLKWPSSTRRAQATMLAVQVQACMFAHGTLATRSSTSHLAGMQVSAQPRERKVSVPTFRRIRSEQGPCRTHYHTPGHQHLKWPSSTRRAQATMLAVQVQACMFAHGTLATRSSTSHLAGMQVSAQPRERKVSVPTFRRIRSEQGPCRTHYHTPGQQHLK